MAKNPGIEVKMVELEELAGNAFKRERTPSKKIFGFERTGIWTLDHDSLIGNMDCSYAFEGVDEADDVVAMENILSLSKGQGQPFDDDNEQVNETQYDGHIFATVAFDEVVESSIGVGTHQTQTENAGQLHTGTL